MTSLVAARASRPHCQGLRVNTGKPCRHSEHLNGDGYCKFHVPDALQCRGLAKSTGQRCRIKWDLDGNQFCQHHVLQAASSKFPKDAKADGGNEAVATPEGGEEITKVKSKTTATDKANKTKPTCRGTAKSTGQRCRIHWELNDQQFCKLHKDQHATPAAEEIAVPIVRREAPLIRPAAMPSGKTVQCRGIAKTTGKQCRIDWDLNANGFCHHHVGQQQHARL
jgi:hypothetical protein